MSPIAHENLRNPHLPDGSANNRNLELYTEAMRELGEDLRDEDFEAVLALKPEVVIFGSGARLKFVNPALMRCLIDRRIGVETMDTAAACRTYNVLVTEGRCAVAALLMS